MKCKFQLIAWTLAVGLFAQNAFAVQTEITVFDGQAGTSFGGGGISVEDNETEPGTVPGQIWDLEGLFYDDTDTSAIELTIVGGFDFKNGATGNGITFHTGDIFIDVAGVDLGHSSGYDYVMHFTDRGNDDDAQALNWTGSDTTPYQVIELDSDSQLNDVYYSSLNFSSPYTYNSGGNAPDPNVTGNAQYSASDITGTGFAGEDGNNNHYSLTVDITWLEVLHGEGKDIHLTIGCGNDMIAGSISGGGFPAPDGGLTLVMLGMGLAGMGVVSRRWRK